MRQGRIDYRMARRALLREIANGVRSPGDVCDAHPDLLRAGENIGEPAADECPICASGELRVVTYVFGDKVGRQSGRAVPRNHLGSMHRRFGPLAVYTVEVCTTCSWHHLRESFWLGREAG